MNSPTEVNTRNKCDASVIWLHGLGADGHDFESAAHALNLPNIRFILPNAPHRAVTINNGHVMAAWYDIVSLNQTGAEDEAGIRASQQIVEQLIAQEVAYGIVPQRIAIAGFSQGGAVALFTALRHSQSLAGILALSTYLPLKAKLTSEANIANKNIPIFMAHGKFDEVIKISTAITSRDTLVAAYPQLSWHEYTMAHSVTQEEVMDIRVFLTKIFQVNN